MRHIKSILILFFISGFLGLTAQEKINWISMQQALENNKTNPKKIFVDVYTDWCGWCTKMDKTTFSNPDVIKYMNKNYYCVKFDAEGYEKVTYNNHLFENKDRSKRSTHPFAAALLQGKMSYPSYAFLDEKNRGITVLKGYKKVDGFLPFVKFIASDSFKTQSYQDYQNNVKQTN